MKTRLDEIRRNDLIRAAYQVFTEYGLSGVTVSRIGEQVGMSHGIVNYYFKNKDDLLHAVMRHAFRQISNEAIQRLKQVTTPRERIDAIIRANFAADVFCQETAAAWLSFYAHAHQNKEFARLQMLYYRRLHSDLKHALKQLIAPQEAEKVARGISVMIDGMWVRRAMANMEFTLEEVMALINDYIDDHLDPRKLAPAASARSRQRKSRRLTDAVNAT